jgi:hypothetical protein
MRSSSVKTLVVAVSMVAVISVTAPTAEARPARPSSRTAVSAPRKEDALARAIATMKALQKRLAGVISNIMIGPPHPSPEPSAFSSETLEPLSTRD